MTQIGSFTPTYDADGDVTNDDLYTYTWDSNGRSVKIGNEVLIYDAMGRMVEQDQSGGTYVQFVYDPLGNKLGATSNTSTLTAAFAPLPAGDKVQYNSSGLFLYEHGDWLGSWRNASTPTRSRYYAYNYAPFGEEYPSNASPLTVSFAGMDKDTAGQLYDAANREYTYQGRWPSPDPAGIAAANPANPQSWNRYAYVMNNPLLFTDPAGLNPLTNCNLVEAVPNDASQRVAADGPFDAGEEGAPPPQQNGCVLRVNPNGGGDWFSDWSNSFGVGGAGTVDGGFSIGNTPGMFTGTSIGGKQGVGNWIWLPGDTINASQIDNEPGGGTASSGDGSWSDSGYWLELSQGNSGNYNAFFAPGMNSAYQAMKAAAEKGTKKVTNPDMFEVLSNDDPTQVILEQMYNNPVAKAFRLFGSTLGGFINGLGDFMMSVSPCAPQLRANFPTICAGGPMN